MKERPILFSGPMVRALLEGSKTQTRRAVKATRGRPIEFLGSGGAGGADWNDPQCWGYEHHDSGTWVLLGKDPKDPGSAQYPCPYGQQGDRLWVRETFVQGWPYDAITDRCLQFDEAGKEVPKKTWYRADASDIGWSDADGWEAPVPWKPSIHMPRAACRIQLEITDVRVERLQAIGAADASAEGLLYDSNRMGHWSGDGSQWFMTGRDAYRHLWEQINGANSWATNPWVWALTFKRVEGQQP